MSEYKNKFEDEIIRWLNEHGWKTIKSVYVTADNTTCQIDIIGLGKGFICIETKGHPVDRVKPIVGASTWPYITIYHQYGRMRSPVGQNKRHTDILNKYIAKEFSTLRINDKKPKAPKASPVNIVNGQWCLKGDISERLNLFNLNNLDEINDRFGNYDSIPNYDIVSDKLYEIIIKLSDTSKERLEQHKKYLEYCKKNRLGAWR